MGPGSLTVAHAGSVAEGLLAAAERGQCGEEYLLGGANMPFAAFTAVIARLATGGTRRAPVVLPAWAVALCARLADAADTLTAGLLRSPLDAEIGLILVLDQRADSAKAVRQLGYNVTLAVSENENENANTNGNANQKQVANIAPYTVDGAVRDAIDWLRKRGELGAGAGAGA